MPTVSERLRDRAVLRAALVERFENREVRDAVGLLRRHVLRDVEDKVQRRIARIRRRGRDSGPVTTRRLRQLQKDLRKTVREGLKPVRERVAEGLFPFGQAEATWQRELLVETIPVKVNVALPTAGQLAAIVRSQPFEGEILRRHFANVGERLVQTAMRQIRMGLIEGETTEQIVRRVRGTGPAFRGGAFGVTVRQTATVVRTAITHTANLSRESLYAANRELIGRVQWVATLDSATCPECAGLDGQVFQIGVGIRPPAHHQCRCTTIPVVKSFRELGIRLPELGPGVRSSLDGSIPGNITYARWLRGQSLAVQNEVLGVRRARLWRANKIPLSGFTGSNGRLLTLDELNRKVARLSR
jgi:SPP1 gp7 family putative phage head morphogenesis protein